MVRNSTGVIAVALFCTVSAFGHSAELTCADDSIIAEAVRTRSDIKAFVRCAHELVEQIGEEEAYRAFHNDERWLSDEIYVFVVELVPDSYKATPFVHPVPSEREIAPWGDRGDELGDDTMKEGVRVVQTNGSGWWYYSTVNPATGTTQFKESYLMAVDWNGSRAMIGAGIYLRDLPGTCHASDVNAAAVASAAADRNRRLEEFVRCAAMELESKGYFARMAIEDDARWSDGSIYLFAIDTTGNQVFTGRKLAVNGLPLHEWGGKSRPSDQFGGRNIAAIADTFGETYVYYRTINPATGSVQKKVGFLKRVVAQGVPVLVGAGYYRDD